MARDKLKGRKVSNRTGGYGFDLFAVPSEAHNCVCGRLPKYSDPRQLAYIYRFSTLLDGMGSSPADALYSPIGISFGTRSVSTTLKLRHGPDGAQPRHGSGRAEARVLAHWNMWSQILVRSPDGCGMPGWPQPAP